MTILSQDRGRISIKVIVALALLYSVVHIGIKVVPMYITSEGMKEEMVVKARLSQTIKDEDIVTGLVKKAQELGLPLGPDDFKLLRDENARRMKISAAWDVEVHFFHDAYPPLTVRTFHFAPVIEENYSIKF
jgi:hypothetical protein